MTKHRIKINRIIMNAFFVSVILLLCNLIPKLAYGQEGERNVLLLSSYNENYPSTSLKIDGIKSIFDQNNVVLDIEYMDYKKYESEEYQQILFDLIKYKMNNYMDYDVILAADDNALQFIIRFREDLFKDIPVIFLAVNNLGLANDAATNYQMTGVYENTCIKENIELGLMINPEAAKVIAIVDDTLTGKGDEAQFLSVKQYFDNLSFKVINAFDYTMKELEGILRGIDPDTIVIYMSMNRVKDYNVLTVKENAEFLYRNVSVPILRGQVGGIGDGIFGGLMVDYTKIGSLAAKMAVEVMNGTPISEIEVDYSNHAKYTFDYPLLQKYNIDEEILPEGSKYFNKELSAYEQYKMYFWNVVLVFTVLFVSLLLVTIDNRKRRRIIHRLKAQDEYIEHIANYDDLTDLPNKTLFYEKLCNEISKGHNGTILMLDIDNFNSINDTLGHVYGDDLIKEIAARLSGINIDKFFISRFGGDEFSILIMEEDDRIIIEDYVHKINNVLRDALIIKGRENFISFSIGITRFPKDGTKAEQLLVNVDTAMYRVKHSGKNNFMFYENSMLEEIKRKIELEAMLRTAIKEDGFYLVYQPQVNTLTGEIIAFEGLLRLKDHNIPPNVFIPVAEESGLIIEIGRWVAREAIEQLARWREKGFPLKPVAVNYSNKQLQDEGFCQFLMDTLNKNQISPKYLEIEITESILLEKTDKTFQFLNNASDLGISLALDDFGSGFSSINYLTFIPVYKIKIDKSMCDRFLEPESNTVINDLISLVHGLGLEITAEGIERVEQFNRLRKAGCDYIQGYLFSKPSRVEEIEKIYHYNMIEQLGISQLTGY